MTVTEYIAAKLSSFGYTPMSDEVGVHVIKQGLNPDAEYTTNTHDQSRKALLAMIPDLMPLPTTVSEGDMTITRDRGGLHEFYGMLSTEQNMKNSSRPIIRDRSDAW